jgi:hypothetical protein
VTEALDATRGDYREAMKFSRHARVETILRYDANAGEVAGMIAGE